MSIHYDKLTFTKEQVQRDAEELNGIFEEGDIFYSIVFPFGDSYKEKESTICECSHFTECQNLDNCRKKLTL
tara:strand:+ start:1369 stop:1584 length:216 start_codon:yes stop_codon:yes gene_type:complete